MGSKIRTLQRLAKVGGFLTLLPLTKSKLRAIGGAMKVAGYPSLDSYLDWAKAEHVAEDLPWPPSLERFFQRCKNSAVRGIGEPKRAGVFEIESLLQQPRCRGLL